LTAWLLGTTLAVQTLAVPQPSQSRDVETIKAQARELQANQSEAKIRLADGSTVNGKIVRVEENSFTVRPKTGPEVTLNFAQVSQVKKKGSSKALWIPAIAVGGTLLVLCAAPYPIGFLCRKDPS
jgi:hypothetical protein